MLGLKEDFERAILLISHDLAMISEAAQRVIIMYAGEVVEGASTQEIFGDPLHPYTKGLLQSTPNRAVKSRRLQEIPGTVPNLFGLPPGCLFHPRCPQAMPVCREKSPEWKQTAPQFRAVLTASNRTPFSSVEDLRMHFPLRSGRFQKQKRFTPWTSVSA
jgi:oligopeptide/dipeptide ABC transporter ATP-binding protein